MLLFKKNQTKNKRGVLRGSVSAPYKICQLCLYQNGYTLDDILPMIKPVKFSIQYLIDQQSLAFSKKANQKQDQKANQKQDQKQANQNQKDEKLNRKVVPAIVIYDSPAFS
jgi:hypothetical protein